MGKLENLSKGQTIKFELLDDRYCDVSSSRKFGAAIKTGKNSGYCFPPPLCWCLSTSKLYDSNLPFHKSFLDALSWRYSLWGKEKSIKRCFLRKSEKRRSILNTSKCKQHFPLQQDCSQFPSMLCNPFSVA